MVLGVCVRKVLLGVRKVLLSIRKVLLSARKVLGSLVTDNLTSRTAEDS